MVYCPNPKCDRPINPDNAQFCQQCRTQLILTQRYSLQALLGTGGFGRTFLAKDHYKPSQPTCVVKQFYPQGVNLSEKAAQLFEQEAIRLEELGKHPQIPELYAHFSQESWQYIVQEWIEGQSLEEELKQQGAFTENKIIQLLQDLLPVLQFIHQGKVIHRDIKPTNILRRTGDQKLILVDFGAAKYATASALEKTGTSIGSLGYTAPEQTLGQAIFASDLYSLGVTCLYLLTQVDPLELYNVHEADWDWRSHTVHPTSDSLGQILDKMLTKATRKRFQTASDVLQTLNKGDLGQNYQIASQHTLKGHRAAILCVAFSMDSQYLVSGSRDRMIKLWTVVQDQQQNPTAKTLRGHPDEITTLAFTPHKNTLITGSRQGHLLYWQIPQGRKLNPLTQTQNPLMAVAVHPKTAILATGGANSPIQLWKFPQLHPLGQLTTPTFLGSWCLAFSGNGQYLASGGVDQLIYLWDLTTGELYKTLKGHSGTFAGVKTLSFSPDSQYLASGSQDCTVKLWDVATGTLITTFKDATKAVNAVAFSPDSQYLATGGNDHQLYLYNLPHQHLHRTFKEHTAPITSVCFSPNGQFLATGSLDKTVKLTVVC